MDLDTEIGRTRRLGSSVSVGVGTLCLTAAAFSPAFADSAPGDTGPAETILVTGRRTNLQLLPETIQNTPQSINIIPHEMIEDQGINTLQDALKNVPGITLNAGEGGAHGDTINLRGFAASDDFYLDGLRDTGFYTRDTFDKDSVEVYKGPASTLFGRGSTGGVVNQVTKKPELSNRIDGTLTGGTNSEVQGTADVNHVLSNDAAIRVNAMGLRADTAGRDFDLTRRYGVAPSIAVGIGEPTTVSLSYLHQQEDNIPDYGIPLLFGEPAPVPRNVSYGLPADDRWQTDVNIVTARIAHAFSSDLSITDTARYGNYWYNSRQTAPHYGTTAPTPGTPLSSILIYRDRPSSEGTVTTLMNNMAVTYKATTGPIAHTLTTGVDLDRETAALTRFANQLNQIAPTLLLAPDPFEAFPGTQTTVSSRPKTTADTVGVYAVDTMDIGPHWELTGAVRFDSFAARYHESIAGTQFNHTDNIVNPRTAIVYKPTDAQSFYFSYGTSFDPSAENLSLSARTADLGPEKDHTFEVGAKTTWFDEKVVLTGGLFDTTMTNARVGDPLNATLQVLAGNQRAKGVELSASGYVTDKLEIQVNYTYLDAKTIKSTDPTQVGQPLPNTAHNQGNVWAEYTVSEAWKVGTGLNYLGTRAADSSGLAKVPGYVTWDAMVKYRVSPRLALQLNGYNLTDKYYFANVYDTTPVENHVIPGAARTVTLAASFSY